jgi:hypothetical protein
MRLTLPPTAHGGTAADAFSPEGMKVLTDFVVFGVNLQCSMLKS